jgi:predicted FMN-binding regulatory protein PaiB
MLIHPWDGSPAQQGLGGDPGAAHRGDERRRRLRLHPHDMPPYGRMLPGIRGLCLHITSVAAKFKYDDHNPQEHRARVAEYLENRGSGRDHSAAAQQRRRLQEIGEWKPRH